MPLKKIELICDIPKGVTDEELKQFLLFKYHGHTINECVLDKFKDGEFEVDHFRVECR